MNYLPELKQHALQAASMSIVTASVMMSIASGIIPPWAAIVMAVLLIFAALGDIALWFSIRKLLRRQAGCEPAPEEEKDA